VLLLEYQRLTTMTLFPCGAARSSIWRRNSPNPLAAMVRAIYPVVKILNRPRGRIGKLFLDKMPRMGAYAVFVIGHVFAIIAGPNDRLRRSGTDCQPHFIISTGSPSLDCGPSKAAGALIWSHNRKCVRAGSFSTFQTVISSSRRPYRQSAESMPHIYGRVVRTRHGSGEMRKSRRCWQAWKIVR